MFVEERLNTSNFGKLNILKVKQKNRKTFNRKRKKIKVLQSR